MSNFFDSEIIQEELKEINTLQEEIYGSLLAFSSMDRDARIDKVDKLCLLYTSPSPRDGLLSRMPSSA